ncbi:MAG TPA: hypothetical protein P5307_07995 [Pirellulaceae bacterium]|nr:hypothetical protein [Pirellulaceae bacterium]
MRKLTRLAFSAVMISQLLALSGCGGGVSEDPLVIVSGTLHKEGQPLPMERADVGLGSVQLTLTPVGEGGISDYANAAEDGTFTFIGAGDGIAPGQYRFEIVHQKSGPGVDELKGAFTADKSPIMIDVPVDKAGGEHELGIIELNEYGSK